VHVKSSVAVVQRCAQQSAINASRSSANLRAGYVWTAVPPGFLVVLARELQVVVQRLAVDGLAALTGLGDRRDASRAVVWTK